MNKVQIISIIAAITVGSMHAIRFYLDNKNKKQYEIKRI